MAQKKLDLLELAAGMVAESSTGSSKIVWRKPSSVN
jgi:hypothetical protein